MSPTLYLDYTTELSKRIFLQNYSYYKFKFELCKLLQKNPYLKHNI